MNPSSAKRFYSKYTASQKARTNVVQARIQDLPNEILQQILGYLPVDSLQNASAVCRKWRDFVNDEHLWENQYKVYFNHGSQSSYKKLKKLLLNPPAPDYTVCWKKEFLNRCHVETKKFISKLKTSNYTGVTDNVQSYFTKYCFTFDLCITDNSKKEHWFTSAVRHTFFTGTFLQWNSLDRFPSVKQIQKLFVFANIPMIFTKAKETPRKKTLVFSIDLPSYKTIERVAYDKQHRLTLSAFSNVVLALWSDSSDIAFIGVCLHHYKIIEKCLLSTDHSIYSISPKQIPDDIDSSYGQHGYQCYIHLHSAANTIWEHKFSYLNCDQYPENGYFVMKPDQYGCDKIDYSKFRWKTELFHGFIDDVMLVDVTLVDCNKEVLWAKSCPTNATTTSSNDVGMTQVQQLHKVFLSDEHGYLSITYSKSEKDFLPQVVIGLSVKFINLWFDRNY